MSYQIVAGVDGSPSSTLALRWAVEEARLHDGRVLALFAWEFPMIGVPGAFERDQLEQQARALINDHVTSLSEQDVRVESVIANGEPSASLIAACEQAAADLLVIGARRRNGVAGMLIGSIEQQCIAYAPCPVLVVKPVTGPPSGSAPSGSSPGALRG
jgi:nucleotide-binding universal stress UspA family protein